MTTEISVMYGSGGVKEKINKNVFLHFFAKIPPKLISYNINIIIIIYSLSDESASESICLYSVMFKLTASINYLKIHSYIKKKISRCSVRVFFGAFQPPLFFTKFGRIVHIVIKEQNFVQDCYRVY